MGVKLRMLGIVAAVVLVFGFFPLSLSADMIEVWGTGFENDLPPGANADGNWRVVQSTASAYDGLRGLDITGPTGSTGDVIFFPIPSTGYGNLILDGWSKVRESLEGNDLVLLQFTVDDGQTWETLATYANQIAGEWVSFRLNFSESADNNPELALRLWASLSSGADRIGYDDFSLRGQVVPEPVTLRLLGLGVLICVCRGFRYQSR